MISHNRR